MNIRLFNTMDRSIEQVEPIESGKIAMYACGPTVWNYAHIGNLRTYLFEDLLRRTFEYAGYEVNHVMNITDVGHLTDDSDDGEDKMVKGARESGRTVWEIAEHYTDAFFRDTDALNILRPHTSCRATDHVDEMIRIIKQLEDRGYAYESGGNIYFETSKSESYGRLALLDRQELQDGARVPVDRNKRNSSDFALWFTKSKFKNQVMLWDSPWGRGYPGWHIECSAMSMKYLGDRIDIHCGGVDHVAVHHTNEIAQSEGATGRKWVNVWAHGEFLLTDSEKMAKSGENFLTLSVLQSRGFDPLDYRYFCLGAHYRSQLKYTDEAMRSARAGRLNLVHRVRRLGQTTSKRADLGAVGSYQSEIRTHLFSDLGIPQALATLWKMLHDDSVSDPDKLSVALDADRVLGLEFDRATDRGTIDPKFEALIRERESARANRDFKRADEIRDLLDDAGLTIEDTPDGTRWTQRDEL